ncbi:MAG: hypothetical protein ILO34_01515 [Kiritimatiellae bacterium]|nr:hypothetical protein [Kiritimatiellia bacterium]
MPLDYIVCSLPALEFGAEAPVSAERFREIAGEVEIPAEWRDLETQLRNAVAEARGGEKYRRPAHGCSMYWRNRVLACFQEKDVYRRQEAIDRVWWDAAGELADPASPLGKGALAAYAIRLGIAARRAKISKDKGNEAFDRLARETKR